MPIRGRYVSEMVERGEFLWTAHPSTNGVAQAMLHPLDAELALARGHIVVNGMRARVEQTCREWPTVLHLYFDDAGSALALNPRPTDAGRWSATTEVAA